MNTSFHQSVVPRENIRRSIAKAVSWRIVGTLDTFLLSLGVITYLGPLFGMEVPLGGAHIVATAGYIAAAETVTKIVIYSAHERLWARIAWGVSCINGKRCESYRRSALKMTTWRVLASLDTMLLAWFFTGNLVTAFSIGTLEVFTKLILYFFHERIWQKIQIGVG